MRNLIGWIWLACMFPLFIFITIGANNEVQEMKSVTEALDDEIPLKTLPITKNSYIYDSEGSIVSEVVTN